jgi:Domain of unknown function (DUF4266)
MLALPASECRLCRLSAVVNPRRLTGPILVLLALAGALVLGGCAHVAAYERGRLAHPTMDPGDGESPGLDHVRAVQEGAAGGHVGVSSGCGCN